MPPETDNISSESHDGTDEQEQDPCDEARDHWENRSGRWVRVHGIATRTLFDPMRDDQPFSQNLTERRRATVRFLGQKSETKIDGTWPQMGEMRSLLKGTAEFGTQEVPEDDTWEPNRHHSEIRQLIRKWLNRTAGAMHPPFVNTAAQTEHGRRDSSLPVVSHAEDAKENGKTRGFWGCQNYPTCTASTTTTPPVPQHLKMLRIEKKQTQAVNDRIPAKGCRHFLVKPWANGTGKGTTRQLCGAIINDKGEITETSKSIQRRLMIAETPFHSNRKVGGRTALDLVQDEIDEAKRLMEEAHVEVQAAQAKVTEAACQVGEAMDGMAKPKSLMETKLDSAER